jgi:hypothetical protein
MAKRKRTKGQTIIYVTQPMAVIFHPSSVNSTGIFLQTVAAYFSWVAFSK